MRGIERNMRKRKIKENFHSNNCLSSSPMFLIYKTCRNIFERFLNKVEITIFTLRNTFFKNFRCQYKMSLSMIHLIIL